MYYLSIVLAACSGLLYHVSQKHVPSRLDPCVSLMVTFSVALLGTVFWYFSKGSSARLYEDIRSLHWSSAALGLSIIGLELGVLLAYRAGWKISTFNLFYTFLLAFLLIPVGRIFFNEAMSFKSLVGIGVTVVGLLLVKS